MDVLVTIHSIFRWVVLAVLVGVAVYGIAQALRRHPWSPGSARPFSIAAVVLDTQVLIGIVLWVLTQAWDANPFLALIHPIVMLLAVGVAHVALGRARANGSSPAAYWIGGLGFLGALALVLAAIPWAS
jgi:hypothetical protein